MSAHGRSLRSVLSWGALVLAGFALVAVLALVGLTTLLHRASEDVETSTQSVRVAVEAEVALLLHAQATSPILRRDLAGSMQQRLSEAKSYVGDDQESALVDEAVVRVNEYLLAARDAGRPEEEVAARHAAAYSALEELVNINVLQAKAQGRQSARVDYLANLGGLTLALLVLGAAVFAIYWIRGPLIAPVLDLGQAMRQFGRGDLGVRTQVAGFSELKEMAERFNEMAAQIERQREQQRAFLAGIAHDLRNPVNALALSTEVARQDDSLPPDHRVRRALESSARQLRKLDRMISDFLDVAAIEAGQLELRLEFRDLREVVRSATELFTGTSPKHELVLSLPSEPVQAQIDPLRLEQVISNLISNAIKYSPDGGKVEIRIEHAGGELMLAVSDDGLGMSPEARARLFEPFRRGLSHEGILGVGLGLFIVRRLVEAHHGRIEVESAPGAGSTFRVFLPSLSPGDDGPTRDDGPTDSN